MMVHIVVTGEPIPKHQIHSVHITEPEKNHGAGILAHAEQASSGSRAKATIVTTVRLKAQG